MCGSINHCPPNGSLINQFDSTSNQLRDRSKRIKGAKQKRMRALNLTARFAVSLNPGEHSKSQEEGEREREAQQLGMSAIKGVGIIVRLSKLYFSLILFYALVFALCCSHKWNKSARLFASAILRAKKRTQPQFKSPKPS